MRPVKAVAADPPAQIAAAIEEAQPAMRSDEWRRVIGGRIEVGLPLVVGTIEPRGELATSTVTKEANDLLWLAVFAAQIDARAGRRVGKLKDDFVKTHDWQRRKTFGALL